MSDKQLPQEQTRAEHFRNAEICLRVPDGDGYREIWMPLTVLVDILSKNDQILIDGFQKMHRVMHGQE